MVGRSRLPLCQAQRCACLPSSRCTAAPSTRGHHPPTPACHPPPSCRLFEKQPRWNFAQLQKDTNQPTQHLKEVSWQRRQAGTLSRLVRRPAGMQASHIADYHGCLAPAPSPDARSSIPVAPQCCLAHWPKPHSLPSRHPCCAPRHVPTAAPTPSLALSAAHGGECCWAAAAGAGRDCGEEPAGTLQGPLGAQEGCAAADAGGGGCPPGRGPTADKWPAECAQAPCFPLNGLPCATLTPCSAEYRAGGADDPQQQQQQQPPA